MAPIIMQGTTPAVGFAGMWANMEVSNAFTGVAAETFGFAIPLTWGDEGDEVVAMAAGDRFVGIALANIQTSGEPVGEGTSIEAQYGVGDKLGVATQGVVFVPLGEDVAKGDGAFFDPTDGLYYAATGTGRLALPGVEFDGAGNADGVGPLRINIVPGGEAVAAEA